MNGKKLYFRLLRYVRPYWKALIISVLLLALLAATEPLFPMLMRPLLDEGFTNKDDAFIQWIPILIVGIFVVRGILIFTSSYASRWLSSNVVNDLRNEAFKHLMDLPIQFFHNHSSGALASKIAYDVNNVTGAATTVLTTLVRDSLTIIALLGWLFWMDWKLTLITLSIAPFFIVSMRYFNKRMRYLSREAQLSMAQLTHLVEQASSSQQVVKIFHGKNFEIERFQKANSYQRGVSIRMGIASFSIVPLTQIITSIAISVIISLAIYGENNVTNTAGGFMSFLTALLLLLSPVKRLTGLTPILQKGLAAAESVFELIDKTAENDTGKQIINRLNGDICFKAVNFSYEKINIINNLTLNIKAGMTTALVGRSGSGKTTLVNLLPRLYEINSGTIHIGKYDIQDLSVTTLRNNIALVSQDVRLFNDSISTNVAYGHKEQDSEKIITALKQAHAWEFVKNMPNGKETTIGQDGVKLSGGQRQRISIARAFYKNAPILILDEATSALDTESEKYVQNALNKLMKNRTTIVIAHRLSTIENADHIVFMDKGRIIEQGKHCDLLTRKGRYAELHKLQFSEILQ